MLLALSEVELQNLGCSPKVAQSNNNSSDVVFFVVGSDGMVRRAVQMLNLHGNRVFGAFFTGAQGFVTVREPSDRGQGVWEASVSQDLPSVS